MVLGLCAVQQENKAPELSNVGLQEAGFIKMQPSTGTAHEVSQCLSCLCEVLHVRPMSAWFTPTSQKHAGRQTDCIKLPLTVHVCVCVCVVLCNRLTSHSESIPTSQPVIPGRAISHNKVTEDDLNV